MTHHVCENMNQFRIRIREVWARPHNPGYAMYLRTFDRFETVAALKTYATELGARAIVLDIDQALSDEQQALLARKGPRFVIMTLPGIESMTPEGRAGLSAALNTGGRAFPIIVEERPIAANESAEVPTAADAA